MTPLDELFDEIYSPTPVAQYQPGWPPPRPRRSPEFTWMGKRESFGKPVDHQQAIEDAILELCTLISLLTTESQRVMEEAG